MEKYISLASLIVAIFALLVRVFLYKKQKKDSETLNLKIIFELSKLGAGKDYRYEYVIVNNSQKSTYITEVYIEFYEFNQYINRIKYLGQAEGMEELDRNLLPYSSVRGFIGELDEFYKTNIYIRIAVYTQEFEGIKSNFFDPRQNGSITESEIKKLKKKLND